MGSPFPWEMEKPRYIPRMNDTVTLEAVNGRFTVVGVDASTKTALVQTTSFPPIVHRASWVKISHLDDSQNAYPSEPVPPETTRN